MSEDRAISSDFRDRLLAVRKRIKQSAERAGRDPSAIGLVAVSKTWPAANVLDLAALDQLVFGENRLQEAGTKIRRVRDAWNGAPVVWRLVGHLQRNKVRQALELFDFIDSVDSFRLLHAIGQEAVKRKLCVPVLLQFNCSNEETKGGFDPKDAHELARRLAEQPGIDPQGLMTLGPLAENPESSRSAFQTLRHIRDDLVQQTGRDLPDLSMGMSADVEVGIEEGATLVRVGSALFGSRG